MMDTATMPPLTDLHPTPDDILGDTVEGLSSTPKRLSSKYFYDARGSQLFEQITRLPEYYLTRVELALLEASMPAIAAAVNGCPHVVEYGSGSGRKTRLLLAGLVDPVAYTPIEISRTALLASVERLGEEFPDIEMLPVCADFTQPVPLPRPERDAGHTLVFFPGSTLGNFTADAAERLLRSMRTTMGPQGQALIGIDLVKDVAAMEAAYNDAAGVTAAFTLNLLARLNRDVGTDFDIGGFTHLARYVSERERIETFLVSRREQNVHVDGRVFRFGAGEAMQVEYSHKYTEASFQMLASRAGLRVVERWNAPGDAFGLRLLQPA
ncbi:L-histidine N(alpha)-methyltransferase [Marilutibacter chinensis]|uniref:L-histidine N(Alpha)-methyltransferase n=1 Tax=Marilutibacter chinensis TaxID=2912247 RepID=A0ABS9HXT9_9GAMM|nr:L-histidine N(alpha)-methyltransferase [Lysobacter chinensis]MCF7223686.1 L-histidine N(alpha)-methyltransferase [Lysobacter chinensis]